MTIDRSSTGAGTGTAYTYTLASDLASTAHGLGASLVGVEDAAGKYISTTVEGSLAEAATTAALAASTGAGLVGSTGPSTVQADITARPTSAVLAASSGSSLVGFIQSGTGATARTLQAKSREIVSVTDFGATGDGTTDDAAAITLALAAAAATVPSNGGGAKVLLPHGIYIISSQIQVPPQVQLVGEGRASEIEASASFPINTALVRLGTGAALAFNCRTENLSINCNNVAGSVGIYSTDLQEQSGAYNTLVRAYGKNGIVIDGASGQGCSDYIFDTIECNTNTGGAGNDGIWIKSAQSWKCCWNNISIVGPVGTPGDNGFRITGAVNTQIITGLHVENFANGLIAEVNTQNVLIFGMDTNGCTDSIETATAGRLMAIGVYRSGGTNTVNDTVAGVTITSAVMPQYVRGDIIDVAGITNRSTLKQLGQPQLVASVASPLYLDKSAAAIGTGRLRFYVGDGTGGSVADQNYMVLLNTFFRVIGTATGTTEIFRFTNAGVGQVVANRFEEAQGAVLTAANNLTLGGDGNYFQVNGATQINLILNTDWQGGSVVTLKFNSTPTVKHNFAASGNNKPVMLAGAVDFVASANDTLTLRYDSTDAVWYEQSRAVI